MMYFTYFESPIQKLILTSDGTYLTGLYMLGQKYSPAIAAPDWIEDNNAEPFAITREQLSTYFAGQLTRFDLPLLGHGTPFQQQVWKALQAIPYGTTISYGELAHRIGQPKSSRAVGLANGRNPIAIMVPCHRVISATGKLTGYSGGLEKKEWLLRHEQVFLS
jgi:methylated-DNA-[protein]-cysteine S-methyltransferase